jgi:hypothetical protein
MSKTLVIHIFHADQDSLSTGAHVSERIRQVKDEQGAALEVYVFGPAERALGEPGKSEFRDTLVSLAREGVPVHVCRNIAEAMGAAEEFRRLGFVLEYARDAFLRYALAGATVVSF